MIANPMPLLQSFIPLEPTGPIADTPNVTVAATASEVAVCVGPMPEIGFEKSVFEIAKVKIGDTETNPVIPLTVKGIDVP